MTVTWWQDGGDLAARLGDQAGKPVTETVVALLTLAAYVLTFAFAGNGCWLDVATAVGISAILGYCTMFVAAKPPACPVSHAIHGSHRGTRAQLLARGVLAAAVVLAGAAAMNVFLYAMTGTQTLAARVVALLFIPLHCCLLAIADVTGALAIASAAGARGIRRGRALRDWLVWFNAPALLTFGALRWGGVI